MRFRVNLSDISAFFVDGEFRWWKQQYSVGGGGGSLASMGKKLQLEKENGNNEQKENIDSAAAANGHRHGHRDDNGNGKKITNENVNVQENHNKATVLVDGKEKSGDGVIQVAGSKRHENKAAEKEKEDIGEPRKMQEGSKIEDDESSTSAEEDEVNTGDLFFLPLLKKTGMVVALEQVNK
jgi:aspartyl-tRNA synthetase